MREGLSKTRIRSIVAATILSAAALDAAPGTAFAARPPQGQQAQPTSAPAAADQAPQAPKAVRRPLPDVAIVARDGTATTTGAALPAAGKWLLIHVKRGSVPSETLLGRLQGPGWEQLPPHLTIIVSGSTPEEVAQMTSQFPSLAAATWYADQPGALAKALAIQEIPTVLGMNQRGIQWTLAGVIAQSQRMQQVLTGWAGIEQTPQNQASPR